MPRPPPIPPLSPPPPPSLSGRDPTFLRVRGTRHSTAAVATRARDLAGPGPFGGDLDRPAWAQAVGPSDGNRSLGPAPSTRSSDRKSTRLNSSHLVISYAVFC